MIGRWCPITEKPVLVSSTIHSPLNTLKNTVADKAGPKAGTNPVLQRLLREGSLLVYFLLALFLLIALVSHSPDDPGFTTTGSGAEVSNAVGVYGAWLADLLFELFGYLAYAFPALMIFKVYTAFRDSGQEVTFSWPLTGIKTGGLLLLILAACALSTLHIEVRAPADFKAGGIVGSILVEQTVPLLASLGSTLLFLAMFLFGLTLAAAISWLAVVDRTGLITLQLLAWCRTRGQNWLEARRQRRATRDRVASRKQALDIHKAREKQRIPPTIESLKPEQPATSDRVEKERQGSLFETASIKELPAINLLDAWTETNEAGFSRESLEAMSRLLELKLKDFGIEIAVTAVNPGPVITRFEVQPAAGVKVSSITNLAKDLARSLAVKSVRVVEVIPGKTVIGIEIPNEHRQIIQLGQTLAAKEFDLASSPLSMALGHDIVGKPVVVDLAKMPHLLVAGTTGSGKSVGLNTMILSLLFKSTPEQVRLIMIDPKVLELSGYDGIPHLLAPVITDPSMKEAVNALRWCVAEMERRYQLLAALGVRNLAGYNRKVQDGKKAGTPMLDPMWQSDPLRPAEEQSAPELDALPCIVVIADELADMMIKVGKKVEELIARIAQKARAAGIHLILATQRPEASVLTGLIKSNIPTRIAFQVQQKLESRIILGVSGAEQLLGKGDMLFLPPGSGIPTRVHGAFASDEEVHRVAADWKRRGKPVYIDAITDGSEENDSLRGDLAGEEGQEDDALYDEAVRFVTESRKASISAVQRRLRIGYNRAARMIESMEAAGVVSAMHSNGSREVIAPAPPRD